MTLDRRDSDAVAIPRPLRDPSPGTLECGRYQAAWYVAATEWGQEDLARGECLQRGIQTFLPLVRVVVPCKDGRRLRKTEKAFPAYLFVLIVAPGDWHQLKRCRGLAGVLPEVGDRERPAKVPQPWMDTMLAAASKEGVLEAFSAPPDLPADKHGERVTVTSGLFAGQSGTCEWSAAPRVAVLLDAVGLGRVTLDRRYVEAAEGGS